MNRNNPTEDDWQFVVGSAKEWRSAGSASIKSPTDRATSAAASPAVISPMTPGYRHHCLRQFQRRSLKVCAAAELTIFLYTADGGRDCRVQ
jgi:hypothetical protein